MLGFAQRLFLENSSSTPWGMKTHLSAWPTLDKMLSMHCIDYVDFALAQRILHTIGHTDEALAALICHLSLAARQGHLCVKITAHSINPPPEDVWQPDERKKGEFFENSEATFSLLNKLILEGAKTLSPRLISQIDDLASTLITPIGKFKDFYYLQRYWLLETIFLKQLQKLLHPSSSQINLDIGKAKYLINELQMQKKLLPEQAQAVLHGCQHLFSVVTGGPGTGKTHTAGILFQVFWQSMSAEQKVTCRFALAAPTGKAAAQLESSIRRALNGIQDFPNLTAQTLHGLLGIGKRKNHPTINADVILVDECSMIDAQLMGQLLTALKPGARLIMLGDQHQLPPVESGSLFADLVTYLSGETLQQHHITELKTCLRAELKGIVELAAQIKNGSTEVTNQLVQGSSAYEGVSFRSFVEGINPKETQKKLLNYILPQLQFEPCLGINPLELLQHYAKFRVLSPMRKGPFGVETLNALCFQMLSARSSRKEALILPIMITVNHPRLGLCNGEMGILVKFIDGQVENRDEAYFISRETGDEVRKISALLLPKYEYAFCISVHKSQGSEFEHVVMVLPEGAEFFGREALYTGITRAKRKLELWGSESVLSKMIQRKALRCSGVHERLGVR